MKTIQRLVLIASRVWRPPGSKRATPDIQALKRRAHAQLQTRLPPHLLKDVGADDG